MRPENTILTVKYGGTGALLKIDGIMRKKQYVEKLRNTCRNTSQDISQEVKAWAQIGLQMDNDPKHTTKLVMTTKSRSGHHKALISVV